MASKHGITNKEQLITFLMNHKLTKKQANAQLKIGYKIELEHTNNQEVAAIIAADHLVEFPTYYTALAKMEKALVAAKSNKSVVEPLYFQPIPHGLLFNYENVKSRLQEEGLQIVDAEWKSAADKKIHEILIIVEPKNVNKMKRIEGEIDDHLQASGVTQSGTRSIIVQTTPSGDLLFVVEGGISRVYQEENEEIGI